MNKEAVRSEIVLLLNKYSKLVDSGKIKSYNEEMTKKDFILPLFRALGWNIEDSSEVSAEEKISKGRVDYGFRIDGIPKFFLEAKPLKANLDDPQYVEQAINYAYLKGCTWAILTDFEGIKVFNAEWKTINPPQSLFFSIDCHNFLNRIDQLLLLSKDSFAERLLTKEAEKWGNKTKKIPIDKRLLSDLTKFRELLTKDVLKNNRIKDMSRDELDESVQRILDRLIFIRVLEDRQLEEPFLRNIVRADRHKRLYNKLNVQFRIIDDIYNSKLFEKHLCEDLIITDTVLEKIVEGLFETPDRIPYDFSAIDADVLGNIYEQYLGHILKKTPKRAKLTSGKAHRKEQGIYYTPTYVVDYIVRNTIGELAKNKKFNMKNIKVLDPACGSGSFLMKAFDYLVMLNIKGATEQTKLDLSGKGVVMYSEKVRILENNIFGVDLDPKATEISQLNLLLKAAEKKHRLPTLRENIRVGNSLIDDSKVVDRSLKWGEDFKDIMIKGGFDVIIGNPPYGATFNKIEMKYLNTYTTAQGELDSFELFIDRALGLLRDGGYLGFIVPNTFLTNRNSLKLRSYLLNNSSIKKILSMPQNVFNEPTVDTIILILQKTKISRSKTGVVLYDKKIKLKDINLKKAQECYSINQKRWLNQEGHQINIQVNPSDTILNKLNKIPNKLKDISYVSSEGIKTGNDKKYISRVKLSNGYKPILRSRNISRYFMEPELEYVNYGKQLSNPGNESLFLESEKIVLQRIRNLSLKRRLVASLDTERRYLLKTASIHIRNNKINLKYLLAIINSKLINYYFSKNFLDFTIKKGYIEKIPIVVNPKISQASIAQLVNHLLSINKHIQALRDKKTDEKARLEKEAQRIDNQIDELVYKIYNITENEKKIIEASLI